MLVNRPYLSSRTSVSVARGDEGGRDSRDTTETGNGLKFIGIDEESLRVDEVLTSVEELDPTDDYRTSLDACVVVDVIMMFYNPIPFSSVWVWERGRGTDEGCTPWRRRTRRRGGRRWSCLRSG